MGVWIVLLLSKLMVEEERGCLLGYKVAMGDDDAQIDGWLEK